MSLQSLFSRFPRINKSTLLYRHFALIIAETDAKLSKPIWPIFVRTLFLSNYFNSSKMENLAKKERLPKGSTTNSDTG